MSGSWPAGAVFGVGWLIFTTPIYLISIIWFSRRRNIQPIKARSPTLVLITDVILFLYTVSLCVQRIIDNHFPCFLNLWSGYIGTVVLFNSYLWRCWTLYFNFNLAVIRLGLSAGSAAEDGTNANSGKEKEKKEKEDGENFFMTHRWMTQGAFLSKVAVSVFILLLIPPFILSVTHPVIFSEYGDGCQQWWGPTLLAVYVAVYVIIFTFFAFSLRSVVDGFRIKVELGVTGLIAFLAVIPWFAFNKWASDINSNMFPFSTMCLLIAIMSAFGASTIFPLYASIFVSNQNLAEEAENQGAKNSGSGGMRRGSSSLAPGSGFLALGLEGVDSSSNIMLSSLASLHDTDASSSSSSSKSVLPTLAYDRLYNILSDTRGCHAFKHFLTKEFSVENIVFYLEIEEFRKTIKQHFMKQMKNTHVQHVMQSLKIHAKYIAVGSPYQVNLPDPVVKNCEAHLKYEAYLHQMNPEIVAHVGVAAASQSKRGVTQTGLGGGSSPASPSALDAASGTTPTNLTFPGRSSSPSSSSSSSSSSPPPADWGHPPPPQQPPLEHLDKTTPTIFDDAQRTIYLLMEKDSMLRFVRSDLYREWIETIKQEQHKNKVLAEMNLV